MPANTPYPDESNAEFQARQNKKKKGFSEDDEGVDDSAAVTPFSDEDDADTFGATDEVEAGVDPLAGEDPSMMLDIPEMPEDDPMSPMMTEQIDPKLVALIKALAGIQ